MKLANGATLFDMGLIFATVGDAERSFPALKAEEYTTTASATTIRTEVII